MPLQQAHKSAGSTSLRMALGRERPGVHAQSHAHMHDGVRANKHTQTADVHTLLCKRLWHFSPQALHAAPPTMLLSVCVCVFKA